MTENSALNRSPAPSKRSGYARSRDTRARILAAALAEASESGFHKTSVARIAARADVAVGNLHYHFGSRRELLRELMVSLVADLLSRLHVAHPDEGADFFSRERAGLLVYLEYLRANPAYVRLADEVKLHDPELYRRAVAGWVERYVVRFRAGIERGTLRPMDDSEITAQAHFLLGARHFLDQMMESVDGRPYPGDEAVVDAYMSLVRDGLGRKRSIESGEQKQ
ncbi:MAG: TetR/AcrR family transcriptional regulator [Myxococcota bacterium]